MCSCNYIVSITIVSITIVSITIVSITIVSVTIVSVTIVSVTIVYGISPPPLSQNELMQQPLAHLYFTTVFHHLLSNNFDLPGLVRVASAIQTVSHTPPHATPTTLITYRSFTELTK